MCSQSRVVPVPVFLLHALLPTSPSALPLPPPPLLPLPPLLLLLLFPLLLLLLLLLLLPPPLPEVSCRTVVLQKAIALKEHGVGEKVCGAASLSYGFM